MQSSLSSIQEMFLGQSIIIGHNGGYYTTYIGVLYKTPCANLFWPMLSKGYCSWLEGWSEDAVPLLQYPEIAEWIITYILTISEVLHNFTKNEREINTLIWVFCKTPWVESFFVLAIQGVLFMIKRMELNCNTLICIP